MTKLRLNSADVFLTAGLMSVCLRFLAAEIQRRPTGARSRAARRPNPPERDPPQPQAQAGPKPRSGSTRQEEGQEQPGQAPPPPPARAGRRRRRGPQRRREGLRRGEVQRAAVSERLTQTAQPLGRRGRAPTERPPPRADERPPEVAAEGPGGVVIGYQTRAQGRPLEDVRWGENKFDLLTRCNTSVAQSGRVDARGHAWPERRAACVRSLQRVAAWRFCGKRNKNVFI